jgi:putative colanic acid biosynthesis acetyltransferase WcaF
MTEDRHIRDAAQHDPFSGAATFALRHRLVRLSFGIVWAVLCKWTPNPLHGWRAFVLRLFGARIGPGVFLYPDVRVWYPPNLTMKASSTLGPGVICYTMAPIEIGTKAIVSQGAHLCAGTHDIDDDHFQLKAAPIVIGDHAWIAAEAFVGPGVTVAEGAVLGARGVTVKDLPAWTVHAGNPARYIRDRKGRPH